ncbi:porin [Hwanghaeella sp.]|uniref:porin n=1 Tax=Hwanghaeella sp. TaxID=2605943 RepID=UPI003CCC3C1F
MKKTLLATSALIGASVLAAGAANAGEAPVVSFSGALSYEYIFVDNDTRGVNGTDGHVLTANEQQSELVWDARGTADNGLEYGANIQWRAMGVDAGTGAFDEAYLDFRGSWGRLFVGSEDGVDGLIIPDANGIQVGTWGTDGNGANRAENTMNNIGVNTGSGYYHDPAHYTGDSAKIGYLTPSFGGFQAGVSFAPDPNDDTRSDFAEDGSSNGVELAAAYNGDFDGIGFGIGASYGFAEANQTGTSLNGLEDIESWRIGASVSVAGFSFAADYLDNGDSSCAANSATCDAGDGWSVGAAYSFGPAAVSASWQTFEENDGANDIELDVFHAGVNYQVAEGLSARINGYHLSGDTSAATGSEDSSVVIVGTRVTF